MRTAVLLASALVGLVGATAARAPVFDLDADRVPVVELKGLWRFHTGDDSDGKLGWASPEFDDAKWKLIRSDLPWDEQGYKGYTGFAWYRVQVKLPQKRIPLAIGIPHISTSYQVFTDGRLIGQFGGMPPMRRLKLNHPRSFFCRMKRPLRSSRLCLLFGSGICRFGMPMTAAGFQLRLASETLSLARSRMPVPYLRRSALNRWWPVMYFHPSPSLVGTFPFYFSFQAS